MKTRATANTIEIVRLEAGERQLGVQDEVAVEEPLEIRIEGYPVAVVMRTPGHECNLRLVGGTVADRRLLDPFWRVFKYRQTPLGRGHVAPQPGKCGL